MTQLRQTTFGTRTSEHDTVSRTPPAPSRHRFGKSALCGTVDGRHALHPADDVAGFQRLYDGGGMGGIPCLDHHFEFGGLHR
jgi:hypothetical protein